MKNHILVFILSFLIVGCKKEIPIINQNSYSLVKKVGGYKIDDKYKQFNNGSDAVFDISLSHIPNVNREEFSSVFQGSITHRQLMCGGTLKLNTLSLKCNDKSYMQKVDDVEVVKSFFGKEMLYSLSGENGVNSFEYRLSVPKYIEMTSPKKGKGFEETFIKKGDVVSWNADNNNSNGVLIMVSWNGSTKSSLTGGKSVLNYNIVPDDGNETLSEAYFENIPVDALLTVTIMRGNFEYFKNTDGITYQLIARSESTISCVVGK